MRLIYQLVTGLLTAAGFSPVLAMPPGEQAASNQRAKTAAETFMKALKNKDISAAMKVAEVPFLFPNLTAGQPMLDKLEKRDALETSLKAVLDQTGELPTVAGEVQSLAELKKAIGDGAERDDPKVQEILEVGGEQGCLVYFLNDKKEKAGCLLIRLKNDTAQVAGILPVAQPGTSEK